jgi:hypothetical protein
MSRNQNTIRRCAIYTRKSSEEGLEQSFSSLDAQREACEAFITRQRHEGWRAMPTRYDDGGYSGGTMERPRITIDTKVRKLELKISDAEIARRLVAWRPPASKCKTGVFAKYVALVRAGSEGAITTPGVGCS